MRNERVLSSGQKGKLPMASGQPEQLHRFPVLACTLPCPRTGYAMVCSLVGIVSEDVTMLVRLDNQTRDLLKVLRIACK